MIAPAQGDVWWAEAEDKRRPMLVVTRSDAAIALEALADCRRLAPPRSSARSGLLTGRR